MARRDQADRGPSHDRERDAASDETVMSALAGVPRARWKRADTTSVVGAGVLGAGIGILLERFLVAYAIPVVVFGLLMHAWGMYDKHRLESGANSRRLWWAEVLYWGCWIGVLALGLYVVLALA